MTRASIWIDTAATCDVVEGGVVRLTFRSGGETIVMAMPLMVAVPLMSRLRRAIADGLGTPAPVVSFSAKRKKLAHTKTGQ